MSIFLPMPTRITITTIHAKCSAIATIGTSFPAFKNDVREVNADEWGNGDMRILHKWWLNHLPKVAGRTSGVVNNWWQYVMGSKSGQPVKGMEFRAVWWGGYLHTNKHWHCRDEQRDPNAAIPDVRAARQYIIGQERGSKPPGRQVRGLFQMSLPQSLRSEACFP